MELVLPHVLATIAALSGSATLEPIPDIVGNPHARSGSVTRAVPDPSSFAPRGIECDNFSQFTLYDEGPELYDVSFFIDAEDLDGDGFIRADAGFYGAYSGPNEVHELSVTFRIDGQIDSSWQCVLDGEILYPFLFLSWDMTEESPKAWDLGSDPGTFFFSGDPVTQAPGIHFFDSFNLVAGEIGDYAGRFSFTAVVENLTQGVCYSELQDALDSAAPGDELVVNPGVYTGQLQWPAFDVTLRSSDGAESTVLVPTPGGGHAANAMIVFPASVTRASVFEGFTITNMDGNQSPVVVYGSPTIKSCVFSHNITSEGGGAAAVYGSPFFDSVVFRENQAYSGGGAVFDASDGLSVYENCVFDSNYSFFWGGAMLFDGVGHKISNCTFVTNSTSVAGPAIAIPELASTPSVEIVNCLFFGNNLDGDASQAIEFAIQNTPIVRYSFTQSDFGGTNSQGDPQFVDPELNDWRLQPGSPAIDGGDNTALSSGTLTDAGGAPRFTDDPNTPDTGNGIAPIIDAGAFEFQPGPAPRCMADFADPIGELNFFDVQAFLFAFQIGNSDADLAPPIGAHDFFDVAEFLSQFTTGCP